VIVLPCVSVRLQGSDSVIKAVLDIGVMRMRVKVVFASPESRLAE